MKLHLCLPWILIPALSSRIWFLLCRALFPSSSQQLSIMTAPVLCYCCLKHLLMAAPFSLVTTRFVLHEPPWWQSSLLNISISIFCSSLLIFCRTNFTTLCSIVTGVSLPKVWSLKISIFRTGNPKAFTMFLPLFLLPILLLFAEELYSASPYLSLQCGDRRRSKRRVDGINHFLSSIWGLSLFTLIANHEVVSLSTHAFYSNVA